MKILSRVPSDLMKIAVQDFKMSLGDPQCQIHMEEWFSWSSVGRTSFYRCGLAGAVMAQSLGAKRDYRMNHQPEYYPENKNQLYAIEQLRKGMIQSAIYQLGFKNKMDILNVKMGDFQPERAGRFLVSIEDMVPFLKELEVAGALIENPRRFICKKEMHFSGGFVYPEGTIFKELAPQEGDKIFLCHHELDKSSYFYNPIKDFDLV